MLPFYLFLLAFMMYFLQYITEALPVVLFNYRVYYIVGKFVGTLMWWIGSLANFNLMDVRM